VALLGTPSGIVETFAALHGPRADSVAREVLAALCDQQDERPVAGDLIGWLDEAGAQHDGAMPEAERVILARHLMQHGVCGIARPGDRKPEAGSYAQTFEAGQYIALARVHLGMSAADAAALSMTELQQLMRAKFEPEKGGRPPPSREEYRKAMARMRTLRDKAPSKAQGVAA
jgi:hypothetical protein